ncbi:MAG: nucleotidyltransferase family protein [Rubrivivax sp.]|nr:MAG: nucleotidyltransferase family protein [Rubrivivax sp.]
MRVDGLMSVAGLILAAGRSSRYGSDKRRARLPSGLSLLETVLGTYRQVFDALMVVLPPDDAFGEGLCARHGAVVAVNRDVDQGMGRSLAVGVEAALAAWPNTTGIVVGLADMPLVSAEAVRAVKAQLMTSGQPVVPIFEGRLGQPRGLPRRLFPRLLGLTGDEGARGLVDWEQAIQLAVSCPGVLIDVDRPADLALPGMPRV